MTDTTNTSHAVAEHLMAFLASGEDVPTLNAQVERYLHAVLSENFRDDDFWVCGADGRDTTANFIYHVLQAEGAPPLSFTRFVAADLAHNYPATAVNIHGQPNGRLYIHLTDPDDTPGLTYVLAPKDSPAPTSDVGYAPAKAYGDPTPRGCSCCGRRTTDGAPGASGETWLCASCSDTEAVEAEAAKRPAYLRSEAAFASAGWDWAAAAAMDYETLQDGVGACVDTLRAMVVERGHSRWLEGDDNFIWRAADRLCAAARSHS